MRNISYMKTERAPIALVLSTVLVMGLVSWLAPSSGVAKAARIDLDGPPLFEPASRSWPRTVTDFDDYVVRVDAPAMRIVSQFWSIDEYLYTVVSPEKVAGVSESAHLPAVSNVLEQVHTHKPVVASDPERVMALSPDLILVSSGARADFTALVRSTGIPIYRLATTFTSLDQIASTIRLIGYLTGEDAAAEREYQRFQRAIAEAREARPEGRARPRILGLGGRYSYGDRTLFHDIVQTVGAVNVGAEGGLRGYSAVSSEQILRWDPEWIIAAAAAGQEQQVRARLLDDPAIALTQAARNDRILIYDQRDFLPMSPFTRRILEQLPKDIYGE